MKIRAGFRRVSLGCLAFTLGVASASAALIHRYSFDDTAARDSVGKIDGRLKGEGARVSGGKLVLTNSSTVTGEPISYLEFSGSILPARGDSVSFLVWFTAKEIGAFARVLNIGDSEGTEGKQFIYFSPNAADGMARVAITAGDVSTKTNVDFAPLDDGNPHLVAIVIDGAAKKLRVYVDGRESGAAEDLRENTLDQVKPVQNWIGKSSFAADPGLSAAIDELRVYDHALTPAEIAAAQSAGPDKLPPTASAPAK